MLMRYVRKSESEDVRKLWVEGFGDEEPYTSWYFREIYRPERTLAAFDDNGTMAFCLQIAPYTLKLKGELLPIAYLVGVVTNTNLAGRGFGHALIRKAMDDLSQSGMKAALLYTHIPDYYAPLGFTHCYRLRALSFPVKEGRLPYHWQVPPADFMHIADYNRVYSKMIRDFDGSITRGEENWRGFLGEHFSDQGGVMFSQNAYFLWQKDKGVLRLREVGYEDKRALQDALEVAQRLAKKKLLSHVVWNAPSAAPILKQLGEQSLPHVMARSLAVPADAPKDRAARATLAMFGAPNDKLWVNELT